MINILNKMLRINNLQAGIKGKKILNGIDLIVNPGELHIILGPNGSGKSTLGNVILGNPKFEILNGEIIFNGENINTLKTYERAKKGIFLSHQHPIRIEGVSTFSLIRTAQKETGEHIGLIKYKNKVKDIFEKCHLNQDFLERDFNLGTSGGESKKIEIASLLALENYCLAFLDEIDSGLDFDALNIVANGINDFISSGKKSVVLVSHSKQIINKLKPNYVHVFCDGKIINSGGIELFEEISKYGYSGEHKSFKCDKCKKNKECKI